MAAAAAKRGRRELNEPSAARERYTPQRNITPEEQYYGMSAEDLARVIRNQYAPPQAAYTAPIIEEMEEAEPITTPPPRRTRQQFPLFEYTTRSPYEEVVQVVRQAGPSVAVQRAPRVKHPMASRIKYKLLKKGYGLYSRLRKLEAERNSGAYINKNGSVKMKYIRHGGRRKDGPGERVPLFEAKRNSILRQMQELKDDVTPFGFGNFILNNVDEPPIGYQLQQRGPNGQPIDLFAQMQAGAAVLGSY